MLRERLRIRRLFGLLFLSHLKVRRPREMAGQPEGVYGQQTAMERLRIGWGFAPPSYVTAEAVTREAARRGTVDARRRDRRSLPGHRAA